MQEDNYDDRKPEEFMKRKKKTTMRTAEKKSVACLDFK